MRIALAQMNPTVGAFDANVAAALELASDAEKGGAQLIVFPEYALCGAISDGLAWSQSFVAAARQAVDEFARRTPIPAIIGSLYGDEDDESGESGTSGVFYCRYGEITALSSGDTEVATIVQDDVRLAVCWGYELEYDEESTELDLIVEVTADAYEGANTLPLADELLMASASRARTARLWLAHCNLVGAFDARVYAGGSYVLSPLGQMLTSAQLFKSDLVFADIEEDGSRDIHLDAALPDLQAPAIDSLESDWEALVLAIYDYYAKCGLSDAVIGLSGGIDSSVVAALATDALGASHVHGVLMPGPYSSEGSVTDAQELATNLGIDTITLPITPALDALKETLAPACGGEVKAVALENLQARVRTVMLMTLANTYGWTLLNTGNKSESAMGFSTLYGDTAGAIAPLGDIYKTRVYALARWRNAQQTTPCIPQASIDKVPSAELYEGARDDDRLPPYETLDAILECHIEGNRGLAQIEALGYDHLTARDVLETVMQFEFKRRQEPFAPEISGASLRERDWPLTNRFCDRG